MGEVVCPEVPKEESLFARVASSTSLSEASSEIRYAVVSGMEIIRTLLETDEERVNALGSTVDQVKQTVEMPWETSPNEVLRTVLGLSLQEVIEWQEEFQRNQKGGAEKRNQPQESKMGKDSLGLDEALDGDQVGTDSVMSQHVQDDTAIEKRVKTMSANPPLANTTGGDLAGAQAPNVKADQDAMTFGGMEAAVLDEKHRRNQEAQERLQAEREAKREGAGKKKLKRLDREENQWYDPKPGVPSMEGLKENPGSAVPDAGQAGENDPEVIRDLGQGTMREGDDKKTRKRRNSRSGKSGRSKRRRSDRDKGKDSRAVNKGRSPPMSQEDEPFKKTAKVLDGPQFQVPPRPKAMPEGGSDTTWTWRSGESEFCEDVAISQPRHGWDKEEEPAKYMPSGAWSSAEPAFLAQPFALPSRVANCVVLRPMETGLTATFVQMGHNALDRIAGRYARDLFVKEGDKSTEVGGGQVVQDEMPQVSSVKKVCGRTGLPMSRKKVDWACPNLACANAIRLVFAKWKRCPLCQSPKPDQVTLGPAMDRPAVAAAAAAEGPNEAQESKSMKEKELMESIRAKQESGREPVSVTASSARQASGTSNESDEPEIVERLAHVRRPQPKARPIFGSGWTRGTSSTERTAAGPVQDSSSFTAPRDREEYMPEGGWCLVAEDVQGKVDPTAIDSTVLYVTPSPAQDGPAIGAGERNRCRDTQMSIGIEDFGVSPTVPFTLSHSLNPKRCRYRDGDNDDDFASEQDVFLFFVGLISDGPRWVVVGEVEVGLVTKQVKALISEGPWNIGRSFRLQNGMSIVSEVREENIRTTSLRLAEDQIFQQMETRMQNQVRDLVCYIGWSNEALQLGQVGTFACDFVARIHTRCWKITVANRPGFLELEDEWAKCVGDFEGSAVAFRVVVVGSCGEFFMTQLSPDGAVIRTPCVQDGLRIVDLFAGIGGWSDAVTGLWGDVVAAVEMDEAKAKALVRTLALPLVRKVKGGEGGNFVFCGDVFDMQWTKASWSAPFTVVLWSSPCVSWSQAGFAAGLESEEGMLMLRSIALLGVLKPCASVGENVAAVVGHQHFPVVQWFAGKMLGKELVTKVLDLQTWAAMVRNRVFLFGGVTKKPVVRPQWLPRDRRQAAKAVIKDQVGLSDAQIPEEVVSILQEYELLPASSRGRLRVGFAPQDVLMARVERGVLPVLMASYRRQHLLPKRLLVSKGLFTFLVQETGDEKPRYLDSFEAARHMGFGIGLCLPSDSQVAAHAVGNAVAPVQAFEVLNDVLTHVWPGLALDGARVERHIMSMVFGQADLCRFTRSKELDVMRLVPDTPVNWSVQSARVLFFWGDGSVWVRDHEAIIRHECELFPFGFAWPVETYAWIREGLGRLVQVRFHKGQLVGDDFVLKVQPWYTVGGIMRIFVQCLKEFREQVGLRIDQKLALLSTQKKWNLPAVKLAVRDQEILLLFDHDRRIAHCQESRTFLETVDWLYPFGMSGFVIEIWDVKVASQVDPTERARGGIYQVFFGVAPFWIAPLGMVVCEPTQEVGRLQERLAVQYFSKQCQVELTGGETVVEQSVTVALAARLGPLQAVVYKDGMRFSEVIMDDQQLTRVKTRNILIPPYGQIRCKETDTIQQVQIYLSARYFGGKDVVRITTNGVIADSRTSVFDADHQGSLRARIFPMRGGARSMVATESILAELLVEHGVNVKAVDGKVRELCEKAGHDKVSALLDGRDPWYRIKK